MGWQLPTAINVGDMVQSEDGARCIDIDARELVGLLGIVRFQGRAYSSPAAVVPERVTFDWPVHEPIFRMRPVD